MANLGYTKKLQFLIFTSEDQYTTQVAAISDWEGILIYREYDNTLVVNNHEYHCNNGEFAKLQSVIDTLSAEGNNLMGITGTTSTIQQQIAEAVGFTGEITPAVGATQPVDNIKDYIDALYAGLSADAATHATKTELQSEATARSNADDALDGRLDVLEGVSGVEVGGFNGATDTASHVKVTITTVAGQTTKVDVNEDDIASDAALQTLDGQAVKSVNGVTGNVVSIDGTQIKVGNSAAEGATSAYATSNISQAIDSLNNAINTLSGATGESESLASIIEKINEIKEEMQAEGVTGTSLSATLLDTLRTLKLRTENSEYTGWDSENSGTTANPIALQTTIDNLAAAIASNSTTDQAYTDSQIASEVTRVDTKIGTDIAAAVNDLDSGVTGGAAVDGTASHVKVGVVQTDGLITSVTVNESDIASAIDVAGISGAVSNLQTSAKTVATGTQGYVNVVQNDTEYTVSTTQALDTELAKVNEVISWTVIGASSNNG